MIRPLTECCPVSGASIGMHTDERVTTVAAGLGVCVTCGLLGPFACLTGPSWPPSLQANPAFGHARYKCCQAHKPLPYCSSCLECLSPFLLPRKHFNFKISVQMSYLFISHNQCLVSAHCPAAWDTQVLNFRQFLPPENFHSGAGDSLSNDRHMNKGK